MTESAGPSGAEADEDQEVLVLPDPGDETDSMVVVEDESLLLDELTERLAPLRILAAGDEIDSVLDSFGAVGTVETEMLQELSSVSPLAHPDRFEQAHRTVMRALEVYDRNGPRKPSSIKGAPKFIRGPARAVIRIMIRAIVRKYEKSVLSEIRSIYAIREAESVVGSREHRMLGRARRQVDQIKSDINKDPIPLPAFIGIGAVISFIVSTVQQGMADEIGRVAVLIVFAALGMPGFYCIVRAAAVARRRTKISLEQPLLALWEVIGNAGGPPGDPAKKFAAVASIILFAVWLIIPVAGLLIAKWFW